MRDYRFEVIIVEVITVESGVSGLKGFDRTSRNVGVAGDKENTTMRAASFVDKTRLK